MPGERASLSRFGIGPQAGQEVFPAGVALLITVERWNEPNVAELENRERGFALAELEGDFGAVPVG